MSTTITTPEGGVRRKLPAWRPLTLALIGAAVLTTTGVGVFATLSATVNNVTPQSVDGGTLELSLGDNGVGFSQDVTNLAPGDTVNRFVTLLNGGSLAGQGLSFSTAATGSSTLITDGVSPVTTQALRIAISSCSIAWVPATGVCGGTTTSVLSPIALSAAGTPQTLIAGSIAVSQSIYLRITVTLPDQAETTVNGVAPLATVQGGSVAITYTFSESQRTATTTNS